METAIAQSSDDLVRGLPAEEVLKRARRARQKQGQANRALLFWMDEIAVRRLYTEWGYSSVFALCELELSLDPHTIAEMLRTSRCLRDLPRLLSASAEIAPSKLREISRVCTPETETYWIGEARTKTYREIEKLVALTPKGGLPAHASPNGNSCAGASETPVLVPPCDASSTNLEAPARSGALLSECSHSSPEECVPVVPVSGCGSNPSREDSSVSETEGAGASVKLRYKFIADLEADAWAVLEEAFRVAQKQSGKRDRAYLIRHLAEFFLHETRAKKEEAGAPVPSAPYRVVIYEAPSAGVAWVEGPNGVHFVGKSKVEEARCCGEILDLRESIRESLCPPAIAGGGEREKGEAPLTSPRTSGPRLKQAIPPSVRRFVFERDQGRCKVPGCRNRAYNHIHHVVFRSQPDSSNHPSNLCLTCSACHRALHDGLLSVEGTAPDGLVWRNAKGRVIGGLSRATTRGSPAGQGLLFGAGG